MSSLLDRAIERTRALLSEPGPTKQRTRILWAAAKDARDLGSSDVVCDAFAALAIETGLIDRSGRWTGADVRESRRQFGSEDIWHVLSWAWRGWNPFEEGPRT